MEHSSSFMLYQTVYVISNNITFVIMRPYIYNAIDTQELLDFVSCCPMVLVHKKHQLDFTKIIHIM